MLYRTNTKISNNKAVPVLLVLAQSLPKSSDSRITVSPVEPSSATLDASAELAKAREAEVGGLEDTEFADLLVSESKEDPVSSLRSGVNPSSSNVVWTVSLAPKQSVSVPFEFTVEAPSSGRGVIVKE